MTNQSTAGSDPATPEDWPTPDSGPFPTERDTDPRKIIHEDLSDWLALHVTGVDLQTCREAADAALDWLEDDMNDRGSGGDWLIP